MLIGFLIGFVYCALGMHVMAWLSERFPVSYEEICGPDHGTVGSLLLRWFSVVLWPMSVLLVFFDEITEGWAP